VFLALGPLAGIRVLDVGAGTGIATRALIARHANVIAIDPGRELLRRAMTHTEGLLTVVADGAALPVRSNVVDLVCFAQSWHWLDPSTRVAEIHRVLRPNGRWAGWWSHARADGRDRLLTDLEQIVDSQFTDGTVVVPYETWLWIATRI